MDGHVPQSARYVGTCLCRAGPMKLSIRMPLAVSFACFLVAACTEHPSSVDPEGAASLSTGEEEFFSYLYRPHDEERVRISRAIPEFGGYFIGSDGHVVVNVTDLRVAAAAQAAVEPIFASRPVDVRSPVRQRDISVRRVDYTFGELRRWRDLVTRKLFLTRVDGLTRVGLSHRLNRIRIGVLSELDRPAIQAQVEALGIPPSAVVFYVSAPGVPDSHKLTDRFDTIMAGITVRDEGADEPCTLGPLAEYGLGSGVFGFLSAAHCTKTPFSTDFGDHYQNHKLTADIIGWEGQDPIANCGTRCRYSDAAWINYTASRVYGFALIARPVDSDPERGHLDIDHALRAFDVSGRLSNPVEGETVNKVGQTTGWTYGIVEHECEDSWIDLDSGVRWDLLCQDVAAYGRDKGDSGAPVFIMEGSNSVWILGIHSDKHPIFGIAAFSAMANIEFDFGMEEELNVGPGVQ